MRVSEHLLALLKATSETVYASRPHLAGHWFINPPSSQAQQYNLVMQSQTPNKESNYKREATKVSIFPDEQ